MTFFARRPMPVYGFAVLSKGSRANVSFAEVAAMAVLANASWPLSGLNP
jgi:hypothetical protein